MKKLLLISLILVSIPFIKGFNGTCSAQNVGINSDGSQPDASAMLDVKSTSSGILIPRVTLSATNDPSPIGSPVTSLLVYNTTPAGTSPYNVVAGFYYWDGSQWVGIGGNNWSQSGNAGTTAGTNFIGTTDTQDVVIKSGNAEVMRASTDKSVKVSGQIYTPMYDIP